MVEDKILGFTHLRIIHSKSGFPKSITFSPFRFANLKETLSQYNYQTKSKEDVPEIERPNVKYSNTIAIIAVIAAGLGILAAIYAGFVGKHR
ncbi:MAG: hypothetical protein LHV69_06520 [Elusimicrobia bacterium]|nr:hypothetical protein [Candidatus Obscuribacterium magneticum]